jgi:hypothetical protein
MDDFLLYRRHAQKLPLCSIKACAGQDAGGKTIKNHPHHTIFMGPIPKYKISQNFVRIHRTGRSRRSGELQQGIFCLEPILVSGPARKTRLSGKTYSRLASMLQAPGGGKKATESILDGRMKKETLATFLRGNKLLSTILAAPPDKRGEILCNLTNISLGIMAVYARQGKGWQDAAEQDPLLGAVSSFHRRLKEARRKSSGVALQD